MKSAQTFGYERRSKVPALPGTTARVCVTCSKFFAARPRERRCDNCLPPSERRRRTARARYAELDASGAQNGAVSRTAGSAAGRPATPESGGSRIKRQVNGTVSDGGALCRELAWELAEKIDFPDGRPVPMSRETKYRITKRNVELGLQDPRDLERYS